MGNPVNENLMELLFSIRTLKREGAKNIRVLLTYMAYARQDRKVGEYTGVFAGDVLFMLNKSGAD